MVELKGVHCDGMEQEESYAILVTLDNGSKEPW
jgi:hypothetical protein